MGTQCQIVTPAGPKLQKYRRLKIFAARLSKTSFVPAHLIKKLASQLYQNTRLALAQSVFLISLCKTSQDHMLHHAVAHVRIVSIVQVTSVVR